MDKIYFFVNSVDFYKIGKWFLELLFAALLGGIVGFEREKHGQGAGFRTNILICISACLMMHLSLNIEVIYRHLNVNSVVRIDPARIASYAIASMGFLGAGAIMKDYGTVRGLTTAASMWLVTGVGLAVGAGLYIPSVITIMIAMPVLFGLRKFKTRFLKEFHIRILLDVDASRCDFSSIENVLKKYSEIFIEFVNFSRDVVANRTVYDINIVCRSDENWRLLARDLRLLDGMYEFKWSHGHDL